MPFPVKLSAQSSAFAVTADTGRRQPEPVKASQNTRETSTLMTDGLTLFASAFSAGRKSRHLADGTARPWTAWKPTQTSGADFLSRTPKLWHSRGAMRHRYHEKLHRPGCCPAANCSACLRSLRPRIHAICIPRQSCKNRLVCDMPAPRRRDQPRSRKGWMARVQNSAEQPRSAARRAVLIDKSYPKTNYEHRHTTTPRQSRGR
jgi:hypothetical protein